jgi:acyl dehydratase
LTRLAQGNHPPFRLSISVDADEKPVTDAPESNLPGLTVIEPVIGQNHVWPGNQDFRKDERNAMFRPIHDVLGRIERVSHEKSIRFWRIFIKDPDGSRPADVLATAPKSADRSCGIAISSCYHRYRIRRPKPDQRVMKFADLSPGMVITTKSYTITEDEMLRFAASYDPQWFHTDPARAAGSRWQGLIGSGWLTGSIAMRLVCEDILAGSESFGSPGMSYIKWPNPTRPGDTIRVDCQVAEVRRSASKPDLGIVRWRWLARNQKDEIVLDLEATGFFQPVAPA